MELRLLKTFLAVATRQGFHRAAQELNYAQSSVSAQIKALEEELGVSLFDRLGRRVQLTPAGEGLLPYARKMLELAAAARAELAEEALAAGSLTIRVPESFGAWRLPPAVARFRQRMPGVRLNFTACAQESLPRDLAGGVVDLAFLLAESLGAAELVSEALGVERLRLAASPAHPLAREGLGGPAGLAGETLLLTRTDCSCRRVLEAELKAAGVAAGAVVEFASLATVLAHTRAGLGVTIATEAALAEDLAQGRLTALAWPARGWEVAQLMLWHRGKWLSPALRGFMAAVRETLLDHKV
ncbi:MAG: LysR family transcriptional regulator [Deltaproteobacteria bacterium]|nr:LysR family transcriptional regulator [Deltaproteobacteria bacterium]